MGSPVAKSLTYFVVSIVYVALPPPRIMVNVFVMVNGALPVTVTVAVYIPSISPLVFSDRFSLLPRGPFTFLNVNVSELTNTLPLRAATVIVSTPDRAYVPLIVTVSVLVFDATQLALSEVKWCFNRGVQK
jgi:hypothetical protein